MTHDVVILGAACVDLVVELPRLPASDETVFASPLAILPGGKGFNQAVSVARLGGTAALVANIGDDDWGRLLLQALDDAGVDTTAVRTIPNARTGAAIIEVEPDGRSTIILPRSEATAPTTDDVARARTLLTEARTSVLQLEFSPNVVQYAAHLSAQTGGLLLGSLAPMHLLPGDLWRALDLLVVNAHEAAAILRAPATDVLAKPGEAVRGLLALGPRAAVITLGAAGAAFADNPANISHTPARQVKAIDTTGAGDAFLGAVALALSRGTSLPAAVAAGTAAAAATVQYRGATLAARRSEPYSADTERPSP